MVVVPAALPVTVVDEPVVELTVPAVTLLLLQAPPVVVSLKVVVPGKVMDVLPVIAAGTGSAVIVAVT